MDAHISDAGSSCHPRAGFTMTVATERLRAGRRQSSSTSPASSSSWHWHGLGWWPGCMCYAMAARQRQSRNAAHCSSGGAYGPLRRARLDQPVHRRPSLEQPPLSPVTSPKERKHNALQARRWMPAPAATRRPPLPGRNLRGPGNHGVAAKVRGQTRSSPVRTPPFCLCQHLLKHLEHQSHNTMHEKLKRRRNLKPIGRVHRETLRGWDSWEGQRLRENAAICHPNEVTSSYKHPKSRS